MIFLFKRLDVYLSDRFLGISSPATSERIKKLEEKGIIEGYSAIVNPESIGINITAFIFVILQSNDKKESFINLVSQLPEIQECHHIIGNDDYLLKVRCPNISDLEKLISEKLKGQNIILKTNTIIALSTLKETK